MSDERKALAARVRAAEKAEAERPAAEARIAAERARLDGEARRLDETVRDGEVAKRLLMETADPALKARLAEAASRRRILEGRGGRLDSASPEAAEVRAAIAAARAEEEQVRALMLKAD